MIFHVGQVYEQKFVVSQEIYESFISISNDRNPLHTDDFFAKSKGFKERVMHGNILGGFLSFFIGECLPTKEVVIHSQSILFKAPVYMSDQLSLKAQVSGVYQSVNAVEFKFTFRNAAAIIVAKGNIQIGVLI